MGKSEENQGKTGLFSCFCRPFADELLKTSLGKSAVSSPWRSISSPPQGKFPTAQTASRGSFVLRTGDTRISRREDACGNSPVPLRLSEPLRIEETPHFCSVTHPSFLDGKTAFANDWDVVRWWLGMKVIVN